MEDNQQKSIAFRLDLFLKTKNWNKKQFAEAMGIHAQNVSKYLNGELDVSNLFKSLHNHGCDLNWLVSGDYPMNGNNNYYMDGNTLSTNKLRNFFHGYILDIIYRLQDLRKENKFIPINGFGIIDEIDEDYISGVENGEIPLSIEYLLFICELFKTNLFWLVSGLGNQHDTNIEISRRLYNYDKLSEEYGVLSKKYNSIEVKFEYANELLKNTLSSKGAHKSQQIDTCSCPADNAKP